MLHAESIFLRDVARHLTHFGVAIIAISAGLLAAGCGGAATAGVQSQFSSSAVTREVPTPPGSQFPTETDNITATPSPVPTSGGK